MIVCRVGVHVCMCVYVKMRRCMLILILGVAQIDFVVVVLHVVHIFFFVHFHLAKKFCDIFEV